jgi:hypothetical protein
MVGVIFGGFLSVDDLELAAFFGIISSYSLLRFSVQFQIKDGQQCRRSQGGGGPNSTKNSSVHDFH